MLLAQILVLAVRSCLAMHGVGDWLAISVAVENALAVQCSQTDTKAIVLRKTGIFVLDFAQRPPHEKRLVGTTRVAEWPPGTSRIYMRGAVLGGKVIPLAVLELGGAQPELHAVPKAMERFFRPNCAPDERKSRADDKVFCRNSVVSEPGPAGEGLQIAADQALALRADADFGMIPFPRAPLAWLSGLEFLHDEAFLARLGWFGDVVVFDGGPNDYDGEPDPRCARVDLLWTLERKLTEPMWEGGKYTRPSECGLMLVNTCGNLVAYRDASANPERRSRPTIIADNWSVDPAYQTSYQFEVHGRVLGFVSGWRRVDGQKLVGRHRCPTCSPAEWLGE